MIYGITGEKGHGKDTFAQMVREEDEEGYYVDHFAADLKEMAAFIFGITLDRFHDPKRKEARFWCPVEMDEHLPAMSLVTQLPLEPRGKVANTPRELLQFFGTDYVRSVDDMYWINRTMSRAALRNDRAQHTLIADTRFPNEADAVRADGGVMVRVICHDAPSSGDRHASETELQGIEVDVTVSAARGDHDLLRYAARLLAQGHLANAPRGLILRR